MFAQLGDIEFELITYFSGLNESNTFNYAQHERINNKPILQYLGQDLQKAFRQNNSVAYENKTLKQIANEIAKKHKLTLVGEIDDVKVERITQNQERDLQFLHRLAEQYGYIFKIAENNLVFYKTEKLINANSAKTLYRKDITRLTLTEKTSQNYKAVTVSYHNPKTGKKVTATAKNKEGVKGDTLKINARCENKQQNRQYETKYDNSPKLFQIWMAIISYMAIHSTILV